MSAFCAFCLKNHAVHLHVNDLALRAAVRAAAASRPLVQALQQKTRTAWMQRFALLHALNQHARQPEGSTK